MSLVDFLNMPRGQNGWMTADMVNKAFQDVYGIDAPATVLYDFANTGAENPQHFYERVAKGDYATDTTKRDPGYMQRAQVQQLANQQIAMQKEFNAPLIPGLEASKTSLQARYDSVLADLKNTQEKDTTSLTKSASAEFAKRGIPLTSDAYTRELAGQLHPVNQDYGVKAAQLGAQEQTDSNAIDQAIAKLKAGNPDVAIPAGNSLFGGVQADQLAQNQYQNVTLPQSQAAIAKTQADTKAVSDNSLENLIKQFKSLG